MRLILGVFCQVEKKKDIEFHPTPLIYDSPGWFGRASHVSPSHQLPHSFSLAEGI